MSPRIQIKKRSLPAGIKQGAFLSAVLTSNSPTILKLRGLFAFEIANASKGKRAVIC